MYPSRGEMFNKYAAYAGACSFENHFTQVEGRTRAFTFCERFFYTHVAVELVANKDEVMPD